MNIKTILNKTEAFFKKNNLDNPRLDAEVLLAHLLDMERIKLYVNFDYPLSTEELNTYRKWVRRRAKKEPVAYITGHKEFMSLDFKVNQKVLLPRPDTEILVETVLDWCEKKELTEPNIVDVGTGSGAIMVSLGYNLENAKILGIDISREILKVAKTNIQKHELQERLKVIKGDLLQPLIEMNKTNVDIVVSNPPYIKEGELENLPPQVQKEPTQALNGGREGLDFYEELIPQSLQVLKDGGLLALEIGMDQAGDLKSILNQENRWEEIEVIKDYGDRDRVIKAVKK